MINDEQLKILNKQTPETLAKWWDVLNKWGWVDDLGPKEEIPHPWRPNTLRGAVLQWIENSIGGRAFGLGRKGRRRNMKKGIKVEYSRSVDEFVEKWVCLHTWVAPAMKEAMKLDLEKLLGALQNAHPSPCKACEKAGVIGGRVKWTTR